MSERKRPYLLPVPLKCDTDKEINMDLVQAYIRKHEERLPRYEYLEKLYEGFHNGFKLPEQVGWTPDIRLAVNFPKYITDVFLGFVFGIPIKRTHEDEKIGEAIADFDKQNDIAEHDFEMAKKVCKYGHAFEYMYQDEDAKTRLTDCTPKEVFVVYENTLRKAAYFAVRYGVTDDGSTKYGEIMTREVIMDFFGSEIKESRPNPYGKIPVVEWLMNEERMSLYEEIAGMTEAINKTIGEKANDVDSFAEAYLAILGAELDEEGIMRIRDDRIINLFGTDNAKDVLVQFLQKPTADDTQENLLDRLEKWIHKISMVCDINSESFGNASGVALEYKLHPMRSLAGNMIQKALKSMRKRYKLFCTLGTNVPNKDAWRELEQTATLNLPKNKLEEAQTAQALDGIVSKETQLKVLSIVDNVQDEIDKMEKEADEAAKKQEEAVASMMFGNPQPPQNNATPGQNEVV